MKLWISLSTDNNTEDDEGLGLPKDPTFQPDNEAEEDESESLKETKSNKEVGF